MESRNVQEKNKIKKLGIIAVVIAAVLCCAVGVVIFYTITCFNIPTQKYANICETIQTTTKEPNKEHTEEIVKIMQTETNDCEDYVLNTNTRKFHYPDCYCIDMMNKKNKIKCRESRKKIIDDGYIPCEKCKP